MSDREELLALRRMAELEAKASGVTPKSTTDAETTTDGHGLLRDIGNVLAGQVRGAGSIGSTILAPFKAAWEGTGQSGAQNERAKLIKGIDEGLSLAGADTGSGAYAIGKFGGELAGTAGVGGLLAKGAQSAGAAPAVIRALETYGLQTGLAPKGVMQVLGNTALKSGGGAATGLATSALINPEDASKGATIGALAGPMLSSGGNLIRWAKDTASPSIGVLGRRAAGDKVDDVIAAMRQTQSRVPGVNLTAGQAAVPANSAEFSAFQKAAALENASNFFGPAGVKGQQEAARQAAVQSFGKTPSDLESAISARTLESARNYAKAFQQKINADPKLIQIFKNPYVQDVLPEALKLAKAKGITPKSDLTEFLNSVKKGLDARLETANNPTLPAISSEVKNAIQGVKSDLVGWMGKKNPLYDVARQRHISASVPINQMQIGQEMERALIDPATNSERAAAFGSKVRQMENAISKKTGAPVIDALTPAQRDVAIAIEEDFRRNQAFKELAAAGKKGMEERIGAPNVPPTGWFQPIVSAIRSWTNKALGTGHEQALKRAATVMHDPQEMARLMDAASPAQRQVIQTILEQRGIQASLVGASSLRSNEQ